jgi:D-lactate dehydrogenase (cytochrome)
MMIKTNIEDLEPYLHDASNLSGGAATSLVSPRTDLEVAELLREAAKEHIPVTVAGAGTGVVGGRVPLGGVVLSTRHLNQIQSIEKLSDSTGFGIAGAGVVLDEYSKASSARGLFYPPDPTEWSCFLGGTVATNASGSKSFKYGSTRDYIRRLKVALSTGDVLDIQRGSLFAEGRSFAVPLPGGRSITGELPAYSMPNTRKNAAGYFIAPGMDLIDLFIGSEGTLGVITEVETRLVPMPAEVVSGVVFFKSEDDLLAFVKEARAISFRSRASVAAETIDARAIEYFDREALLFMRSRNESIPGDAAGAILFEQEMTSESEEILLAAWMELLERHNALLEDSWFATNLADRERLRQFRHALPVTVNEWLTHHGQRKVSTDMAVPDDMFPEMLKFYQDQLKTAGLKYVIFGHIGDSHVHVNILPHNDQEAAAARAMYGRFIERAVAYGGTISAEHGIGKIKRDYLKVQYGEDFLAQMAELKRAFDPACILGRGNIFSDSYLQS